jgi:hypothetical protein
MKHFCHIVDEIHSCRAPERRIMLAKPKRGTSFLYLVSKREIGGQATCGEPIRYIRLCCSSNTAPGVVLSTGLLRNLRKQISIDYYACGQSRKRAREKPVAILVVTEVERLDRFLLGDVPGQLQLRSNIPVQRARAGIDLAKSLSLGPYLEKLQVEPTPRA